MPVGSGDTRRLLHSGVASDTLSHLFWQAVHVGDSLAADVQGGINAGLAATIWVNAKVSSG